MTITQKSDAVFRFQPRWKEELVVIGPAGSFILEMPMGVVSVYLPPEDQWKELAPIWAVSFWSELKSELSAWCKSNKVALHIDLGATVAAI